MTLRSCQRAAGQTTRHIELNVPIAFGRRKVAPLLPKFMAQYPEIEIELTMTDTVINVIEEGADVAIRVGELTDTA